MRMNLCFILTEDVASLNEFTASARYCSWYSERNGKPSRNAGSST